MFGLTQAGRFALELGMLAAFAVWGFTVAPSGLWWAVLGLAAPLAVALLWGRHIAPKAARRWPDPARLVVELVLFAAATAALAATGRPGLALLFGVLVAVDFTILHASRQSETDGSGDATAWMTATDRNGA